MYFAEFDGVGDRSVLILDGRETRLTQCEHAHEWALRYGFRQYRICRGESFLRFLPLTDWRTVKEQTSVN